MNHPAARAFSSKTKLMSRARELTRTLYSRHGHASGERCQEREGGSLVPSRPRDPKLVRGTAIVDLSSSCINCPSRSRAEINIGLVEITTRRSTLASRSPSARHIRWREPDGDEKKISTRCSQLLELAKTESWGPAHHLPSVCR